MMFNQIISGVEYRFAGKPGNCGVLLHASTPRMLYGMFPKSIEAQMNYENAGDFWCIGEDISVPDMEKRRGEKKEWGPRRESLEEFLTSRMVLKSPWENGMQ